MSLFEDLIAAVTTWLKTPFFSISVRISWTGDDEIDSVKTYPTPKDFLNAIMPAAQKIQAKFNIPWMFTAAQAAHESRYGNSKLALEAFNLFGMTGDSWKAKGKPIYEISTLEYNAKKQPYTIVRPFRKYASFEESLEDWAELIVRRYPKAYSAAMAGDFPMFALGLQEGGYATDPQYAMQLENVHTLLEATV